MTNLISIISSILLGISVFYIGYQKQELTKAHIAYTELQKSYDKQKEQYLVEKTRLEDIIDKQNTEIEKYKINIEQTKESIKQTQARLEEEMVNSISRVQEALDTDSSNENQLNLINSILKGFSNG